MITSNVKQIQLNLSKYLITFSKNVDEGMEEIGLRGVGIVKANTPVLKGRMRNSMTFTTKNKRGGLNDSGGEAADINESIYGLQHSTKDKEVYIGTNVVYGPSVEYTSNTGSKGFMLRSYQQLRPIAEKILATILRKTKA